MDLVGSGDSGYSSGVKLLVAPSPAFAPFLPFSFRILLKLVCNRLHIGCTFDWKFGPRVYGSILEDNHLELHGLRGIVGRLVCFCFLPVLTTNPLPLSLTSPHPPNIKYSQYILINHMLGVFNIRGWGGLKISGEGITLLKSSQDHF